MNLISLSPNSDRVIVQGSAPSSILDTPDLLVNQSPNDTSRVANNGDIFEIVTSETTVPYAWKIEIVSGTFAKFNPENNPGMTITNGGLIISGIANDLNPIDINIVYDDADVVPHGTPFSVHDSYTWRIKGNSDTQVNRDLDSAGGVAQALATMTADAVFGGSDISGQDFNNGSCTFVNGWALNMLAGVYTLTKAGWTINWQNSWTYSVQGLWFPAIFTSKIAGELFVSVGTTWIVGEPSADFVGINIAGIVS